MVRPIRRSSAPARCPFSDATLVTSLSERRVTAATEEVARVPVEVALDAMLGHIKEGHEKDRFRFRLYARHAIEVETWRFVQLLAFVVPDFEALRST